MKKMTETSDMSRVGIIKKIDDIPELKEELIQIFETKNKLNISKYGLLLIEHILDIAGMQADEEITKCIHVTRLWRDGNATYQETRQAAALIPDLARMETNQVRAIVLKIVGQVTLIPHVKRHGLIASEYAVTLINLLHPNDFDAVRKERNTQINLMKSV